MIAHSEKEQAAPTWKKTFGFHPLSVFLDRTDIAAGEALAARQRHLVDQAASRRCAELQWLFRYRSHG